MSFNSFGTAVKLKSVQTYDNINTKPKTVFKDQFYSSFKNQDYSQYEEIDYNSIDLQKVTETPENYKEWYDIVTEQYKKSKQKELSIYASMINTTIGFCEGILEFGEDIVDAACWISTISNTGPFLFADLATGIFTGEWDLSNTSAYWNWSTSIISTDLVGETFDYLYDKGPLKYVEDASYGAFKREGGVVYGISKSSGYYATACAVSSVIPGLNPATAKGLTFGMSKLGDSLESSFSKITTDDLGNKKQASLKELGKASAISIAKGVVEGGIMASAESFKALSKAKAYSNLIKEAGTIGIKSFKPLANELVGIANGEDFNTKEVLIDTAAVIVSETVNIGYKKILDISSQKLSNIKLGKSANTNITQSEASKNILKEMQNIQKYNFIKSFASELFLSSKGSEKAMKETVKTAIDQVTEE